MKAEMNAQGVITLKAETGAEAFALKAWIEVNLRKTTFDMLRMEESYWRLNGLMVVADEKVASS